jgi:leader peptidase (prepilin peptidase) / N-methyltransferase
LVTIVGSFLNVVILRLPDPEKSIVFPASHCPRCSTSLSWYENIPLLSYILQRGRCRHCHLPISMQYPIIEALTAALACAVVYKFQLSFIGAAFFLFCAALLVVIVIDIRLQIIPDLISLPGIVLGVVVSTIGGLVPGRVRSSACWSAAASSTPWHSATPCSVKSTVWAVGTSSCWP